MTRGAGGQTGAMVATQLKGVDFPAKKQDLIQHARRNKAEQAVLDELNKMPDMEYKNMADVMKGFAQEHPSH